MTSTTSGLSGRLTASLGRLSPHLQSARRLAGVAVEQARPVLAVISSLGWAVLALGALCWFLGWQGGWSELMVVACAAWLLVLASVPLTLGRSRLSVSLTADPQRVVVGAPAAGAVTVRNISRRPMLPIGLELPIGPDAVRYVLPLLGSNADHDELFVVPTTKRGVVVVGPAMTVRGDPLGLLRRSASWTDSLEIFVHPITVRLDSLGAGLLRDLEGQTTTEISPSDLAFHALRDYQPGDDRRYIAWKSSAKAGRFMVRQFLDTRRSHVCVVVDSAAASYSVPDDFELAVSAAASVAVRVVQDEQEVTVLAGEHASPGSSGMRILDTFARAQLADHSLLDLTRRAVRVAPDTSLALLITGTSVSFEQLQRAANEFPVEVRVICVQVDPTRPTGMRHFRGLTVLALQRLADLPALILGSVT